MAITQSTLLGLLVLYLIIIGLQPERNPYKKIFLVASTIMGIVFMVLNYSFISSYDIEVQFYPFFIIEKHANNTVLSLDWGQVVALGIILNFYFYLRSIKKESISKIASSPHEEVIEDSSDTEPLDTGMENE